MDEKTIKRLIVDYDDGMAIINFIEELNNELLPFGLGLEIEDTEHDGYDVVFLKKL